MKFYKFVIISFLIIGILIIGAVSASENLTEENLMVDDLNCTQTIDNQNLKDSPDLSPDTNKTPTSIESDDLKMYSKDYKKLDIYLKDDGGNGLANKSLTIKINRAKFTRTTDSKGYVGIDIYYVPGNYTADIEFQGDDEYLNSTRSVNIEVLPIRVLVTYGGNFIIDSDKYLEIVFRNLDTPSKLSNEEVIIRLEDEEYKLRIGEDSSAVLPLNLTYGNYTAKLLGFNSDSYEIVGDTLYFQIKKIPTHMDMTIVSLENNSGSFQAILSDYHGNKLSNRTLLIDFNGTHFNKTTDSEGQIDCSFIRDESDCFIAIYFAGDDDYDFTQAFGLIIGSEKNKTEIMPVPDLKNVTVEIDKKDELNDSSPKIKIKKSKVKMSLKSKTFKSKTKNKNLKVTLKDNKGHPLKNAKLTLKIKGKTFTSRTDSKGKAIFKLKLTKKGTYAAKITFKGNSKYNGLSKSVKIYIK